MDVERNRGDAQVTLRLTAAQADQIVQAATQRPREADLKGLEVAVDQLFKSLDGRPDLSSSLLRGLWVLCCFPPDGSERQSRELALRMGLNPSVIHRYTKTLYRLGALEQDPRSRLYRLANRHPGQSRP